MYIPNLPTDNLYKFVALAGVVIVVLSVTYPAVRLAEVEKKLVEVDGDARILSIEHQWVLAEASRLTTDLQALDEAASKLEGKQAPPRADMDTLKTRRDQLAEKRHNIARMDHDVRVKESEVKTRIAQLRVFHIETGYFLALLVVGSIAGLWMTSFGFRAWYHRVQEPQDQLLKRQLDARSPDPKRKGPD